MKFFLAIIPSILLCAQTAFAAPNALADYNLAIRAAASKPKPPQKTTVQSWLENRLLEVFSVKDSDAEFNELFERTWSLGVNLTQNNNPIPREVLRSNLFIQKHTSKSIQLIYEDIREIDTSGNESAGIVAGTFRIKRRGINSTVADSQTHVVFITTVASEGGNKTENLRIVKNDEFVINSPL
ncbi:hypothetical protein HGRIS_001675 [Hohenbuehelia grisea]|uniref:Uncharacterized protein n=1 Tax=Hohenbuehelia grisea TaxID=104357 RepID=A0ABR3JI67_9AGAR